MGARRSAPNPVFESAIKESSEQPKGMGRASSMISAFASGGNMMGRTGRARMTRSNMMDRTDEERKARREERRLTKDTSADDFSMQNVRKRLLERAKERRARRAEQFTQEKQIYNQSLPARMRKRSIPDRTMQMFVGGDLADKEEFYKRTGLRPVNQGNFSEEVTTK